MRLGWLTPDTIPSDGLRRWLCIPNTPALIAAVTGALLPLTYAENWEAYGTITPDEAALAMSLMLEDFVAQNSKCLMLLHAPVIFLDSKAQNVDGGGATAGSWQTRTLNQMNDAGEYGASLASNQFTLPTGKWLIKWRAPAHNVNDHQSRLFSVTENSVIAYGSSGRSNTAGSTNNDSVGITTQNNAAPTTYRIEHRVISTRATDGYGYASNFGDEIYTQVEANLIS